MNGNSPVSDASAPATRVRYQVLFAACTVAVITYVHRVGFASASADFKEEVGLDSTHLGYLTTAFSLAYALFEIPGGLLADRLGVRHVLTLLVLGWSLLTGCVALVVFLPEELAVRLFFLLVLRFLFGAFQAGAFPALSRMMTDWMPMQERASAQGFIWMSSRAGGALVPLLLGVLFGWFTWQASLWMVAGLGAVWCAAFWPWFRNRPEDMEQVNDAERERIWKGRSPAQAGHGHLSWSTMLGSRNVWGLCLMYGFMAFSGSFFVMQLPDYLKHHRGLPAEQTRWLTSLPLAAGAVACLAGGLVSDGLIRRWGNRKWARRINGAIGLVFAGLAMLSTLWVREPWALGVLLCLTFFLNDMNMGPAWAACGDIGERYAGTIGGAMNMIGNLFGALMGTVAGQLLGRGDTPFEIAGFAILGRELLFVLFACSYAIASLCWFMVDVTRPLVAESPTNT